MKTGNGIAPTVAKQVEAEKDFKTDKRNCAMLGAKTHEHEKKIASIGRETEAAVAAGQRDLAKALMAVMYDAIRNRAAESQAAREAEIWAAIDREPGGRFFMTAGDLAWARMSTGKGGSRHG